jgi:hypothetical protein
VHGPPKTGRARLVTLSYSIHYIDQRYLRLSLIIVTGSGHLIYSTDVFGTLQHTETLAFVGTKVVLQEWSMIIREFDLVVGHCKKT